MTDLYEPGWRQWRALTVYADLNCPFCFALEERLAARGVSTEATWKLVEHAPELPVRPDEATDAQMKELADEMVAIRERAEDVQVVPPPYRSNSHLGIVAFTQAHRVDPAKADVLRRSLFRALWIEGRDIADEAVVAELVRAAGLPWPLPDAASAEREARTWTEEWRDANLDRIPCMLTDAETMLLGLSPVRRLDLFLSSGLFSSNGGDACEVRDPSTGPDDP